MALSVLGSNTQRLGDSTVKNPIENPSEDFDDFDEQPSDKVQYHVDNVLLRYLLHPPLLRLLPGAGDFFIVRLVLCPSRFYK